MRHRRRPLSVFGIVRHLVAAILALDRSKDVRAAAEQSSGSAGPGPRDIPFVGSAGDQQQEELVFEDLPEGFHDDVDSITLAVGGHHTCALEYRPGVDFGGPVRCWGRNDWGQSTPSDYLFVQVQLLRAVWEWNCCVCAIVFCPEASTFQSEYMKRFGVWVHAPANRFQKFT